MVKVERKLAKIKNSKISIAAGILLMLVVFGASYGFFTSTSGGSERSLAFSNGLNIQYILNADSEMSFKFNPLDMTSGGVDYVDSNSAAGYVLLGNSSDKEKITCEYEIWYKPTKAFYNTYQASSRVELSLIASDDSGQNEDIEINLDGLVDDTLVKEGYVTVNGLETSITQHWSFKYRHYNLADINQSGHMGDTFGGQIYFKAKSCYEGSFDNGSLDLTEYIITKVYNSKANKDSIAANGAGLYYHNSSLVNGAQDNSYRYAGSDTEVHNYVCFDGDDCSNRNNLFRIISIDSDNKVKVIKANASFVYDSKPWNQYSDTAEYLAGDLDTEQAMELIKGTKYLNIWALKLADDSYVTSTLNDYLNGEYLTNFGIKSSLIDMTTWSVGGVTNDDSLTKSVYNFMLEELNESRGTYGAKVGLMYASDYGFAALPMYWTDPVGDYGSSKGYDWLALGNYPWTITRVRDTLNRALFISSSSGSATNSSGTNCTTGLEVNPVFVLKSTVKIKNATESDIGTSTNPMIISLEL